MQTILAMVQPLALDRTESGIRMYLRSLRCLAANAHASRPAVGRMQLLGLHTPSMAHTTARHDEGSLAAPPPNARAQPLPCPALCHPNSMCINTPALTQHLSSRPFRQPKIHRRRHPMPWTNHPPALLHTQPLMTRRHSPTPKPSPAPRNAPLLPPPTHTRDKASPKMAGH